MSTPDHSDLMVGSSETCTQICNHQINRFNLTNDVVMVKQSTLNGEMQKSVHFVQSDCNLLTRNVEVAGLFVPPVHKRRQQ
ncbi:hypothetical protein QL285_081257 [Trifolium repens]|nr:hypothetical protein QL285_081257 [Trifolium repens]